MWCPRVWNSYLGINTVHVWLHMLRLCLCVCVRLCLIYLKIITLRLLMHQWHVQWECVCALQELVGLPCLLLVPPLCGPDNRQTSQQSSWALPSIQQHSSVHCKTLPRVNFTCRPCVRDTQCCSIKRWRNDLVAVMFQWFLWGTRPQV